MIPNLRTALDAARRGWPVFPLRPGSKVPAMPEWETNATTDTDRIAGYWLRHRAHGVAIACGPARLVVVDLDQPKPGKATPAEWDRPGITDGCDVFADLCATAGQPFPTGTYSVQTGRGGFHLYFTTPAGVELRNTGGGRGRGLGWLVDTRAAGGYVVAAGSVVEGNRYDLVHDVPAAPLPTWLAERLTAPLVAPAPVLPVQLRTARRSAYLDRAVTDECRHVVTAASEAHNAALFMAAQNLGRLVAGGALPEADVYAALLDAERRLAATCTEPHTETQAHKTITSGLRAGAKRPRKVAA
ncbi:bifunctional DNA primase/polymerase [Kribbella qitaiheensis]|uniref:bifunctional DNA primase/polymerase n=1 Tax=Kribbella qitaiheensis TaxID=1544730 RepID=UPI0019D517E1|nr:bifunctional DNA primase/polymerase [Kribbella qitaiheensis]